MYLLQLGGYDGRRIVLEPQEGQRSQLPGVQFRVCAEMRNPFDIKKLAEQMDLSEDELATCELEILEVYGTDRIGVAGAEVVSNTKVQTLPLKLSYYIDPRKEENGEIGTVVFTSDKIVEVELDDRFDHIDTDQFVVNGE